LQERILAPRILHFAEDELFWECRTHSASESMPKGLSGNIDGGVDFKRRPTGTAGSDNSSSYRLELQKSWHDIVKSYSKAKLTYSTDKLVAISGVAK
jgi:hypothetical protein